MREKFWNILHKEKKSPGTVQDILNIIFKNRSLTSTDSIQTFLTPSLNSINFNIGDMDKVVQRLVQAIEKKEKIIVYGDYDADGVTATAIMWEGLHSLGANAKPYIPHREREGYGMSIYGIDYLKETEQAELIITVDQGISAKKQIAYAQQKGIEVIVTDHHHKPAELPENCLIVHDHHVCGAAVAWKVITQLLRHYDIEKGTELPVLSKKLLELVAIGLVCDLIPLQGEARTLVSYGLEELKHSTRPGIQALAKLTSFDLKTMQTYHIGYVIGPRINATGRLEHAIDSLRLLCTKNPEKAMELAEKINSINGERKEITQTLIDEAKKQAQQQKQYNMLIIGDPTWNPGIIGLVASRMIEEFYKPTIAWGANADNPDLFKASARSIKGFNIIEAIGQSGNHLINFGGHPMAAGFSFTPAALKEFSQSIRGYAAPHITEDMLTPSIDIDCPLSLSLASTDLYKEIQKLKPFGTQADEPLFASKNVEVVDCRALGSENKHLKLKVTEKETSQKPFEAIAFNFGEYSAKIRPGTQVDLAFHLDLNEWNGRQTLQLKVRDMKVA